MSKWETSVGFPPALSEVFLYLDTDFVDILFRVPQTQTYFFRVFQKPHKDIQGF